MTNQNPTLTAVNIRYLLVIRELDTEDKGVRGSDIVALLAETSSAQCSRCAGTRLLELR